MEKLFLNFKNRIVTIKTAIAKIDNNTFLIIFSPSYYFKSPS